MKLMNVSKWASKNLYKSVVLIIVLQCLLALVATTLGLTMLAGDIEIPGIWSWISVGVFLGLVIFAPLRSRNKLDRFLNLNTDFSEIIGGQSV